MDRRPRFDAARGVLPGRRAPSLSPIGGLASSGLATCAPCYLPSPYELEVTHVAQGGQVLELKSRGAAGASWAYRYRVGGRGSKRVQRGGYPSRLAAEQALERSLERLRRQTGL